MTDSQATAAARGATAQPPGAPDVNSARTNPVAPVPPGARTAADVLNAGLLARLSRGATGSGRTASRAPFSGDILAELPEAAVRDLADVFAAARAAQPGWAARPLRERCAVLLRFHDLLLGRQAEVLDLIQLETGKARLHAHEEVQSVAVVARHYGRAAGAYLRPRRRGGAVPVLTRVTELRHPRGVIGQVAPWNYPLELSVGDALPALVAGNTIVLKPDSQTALSALWARDLLVTAGLPEDALRIVIGEGPVLGPELLRHADYISFTGSTRTGREIATAAAARLTGVSLELGGKNPMLVLRDADLDRTAAGAVRACFSSAGQLCVSMERLYVHESVADRFLEKFVARTRALRLGSALAYGADLGSLVGPRQLDTVVRHVGEAVEKGATVLAGGVARPDVGPYFYEPTILDGVTDTMAVCADETFGPVVSVYRFRDESEAVARANDTPYGLNASVWTRDAARARRIAARLRTGTVNVNEGYAAAYGSVAAPMGGMKDSGLGRRHGAEGILKYTEAQTVAEQRLIPMGPAFGLDDARYAAFMSRSLRVLKSLRLR